jgi:hypothetical protein
MTSMRQGRGFGGPRGPGRVRADGKGTWHTPRLIVYGDLRRLTRGKGASANDGAPMANSKLPPA